MTIYKPIHLLSQASTLNHKGQRQGDQVKGQHLWPFPSLLQQQPGWILCTHPEELHREAARYQTWVKQTATSKSHENRWITVYFAINVTVMVQVPQWNISCTTNTSSPLWIQYFLPDCLHYRMTVITMERPAQTAASIQVPGPTRATRNNAA